MIDDVLRELQAVGKVESEGEFTLDRGKAREKLRRFQLADPRSYVLELVQAASLKGARQVRFDIDSRDMKMRFDGRPFTAADFDDIYGAAFTRRLDPDVLARKQLALGVNSAMALRPTRITVESGDGQTGARLVLEPDEDDAFEPVQTELCGTLIHVRERFGLGTFVSAIKNLQGTLAEEQLLRARCGYAAMEIDLEGERIDRGLHLGRSDVVTLHQGHTTVVCGLHRKRLATGVVDLVKDDVWIATHRLPVERFPRGLRAVVSDHAIRKDVSQSDIVRDEAYAAMFAVVEQASNMALAGLATRLHDEDRVEWAEEELLQRMRRMAEQGSLLDPAEPSGLAAALRGLPRWETTQEQRLSFDALCEEVRIYGSLPYVIGYRYGGIAPPGRSFVVYFSGVREDAHQGLRVLEAAFGEKLREVSGILRQELAREKARQAWRARPMEPVLPTAAYLVRRTLEGEGIRGELGLTALPADNARIAFVVDGCLLAEHEVELPLLGLRVMLGSDDFEPAHGYDRIAGTAKACAVVLRMVEQLPALYAELAALAHDDWARCCAMSFLEATVRGDPLPKLVAEAMGFPASSFEAARAKVEPAPVSLEVDTDAPHPVATMPLFRALGSARYSLAQLVARARAGERLSVVHELVPDIEADILVLTEEQIDTLEPIFPREFEDGQPELRRLQWRRGFMAKPEWPTPLGSEPGAVIVPIAGEGIEGELRVTPRPGYPLQQRPVGVLHERRRIDEVSVLLAGRCEGWVESSAVHPKADHSGVKQGAGLDRVRAAILEAFARASLVIAERAQARMSVDDQAFLREVVGLMFPTRPFRLAYDRIARAKDVPGYARARVYRWIYAGLQTTDDPSEFDRRLWRLTQSKTPMADAMALPVRKRAIRWALAAVDLLFPPGDDPDDFVARALRPQEPLGVVPIFSRHDGRRVALDEVRAYIESRRMALYVDAEEAVDLGDRLALVADEVHREQLRRMLGGSVLNGEGVLTRERNRRQLEAQAPVARIALAPTPALVSARLPEAPPSKTEGEVGLAHEHDANPQRRPAVSLVAYRERRRVGTVTLSDRPYNLVVAVNDDRFALTYDTKGVQKDRVLLDTVSWCERLVPALITALLECWSSLAPGTRHTAWCHLLDFLVAQRPEAPELWRDGLGRGAALDAAARQPGFRTAGGALVSLVQLAEAHAQRGCIEVLPAPASNWGDSPFGPERPIVCVDAYERVALGQLFGAVEDVQVHWKTWQERARNYRLASEPRRLRPEDCLVVHELTGSRVEGRLVIPAGPAAFEVELCAEGRVIVSRALEGMLPCCGSIWGNAVVPDDRWTDAVVGSSAQDAVRQGSIELYRALGRWLLEHPVHPRRSWAASLLSRRVVELRAREREGTLGAELQPLLAELRPLPVLALRSGRTISLQTALEEQPDELGHLDLWESAAHRLLQLFDERDAQGQPGPEPGGGPPPAEPPPVPPRTAASDAPAPRRPTPEEQLVDDVRAELGLVRARNRALLSDVHLDRIVVEPLSGRRRALVAHADDAGVVINAEHAVVKRALEHRHRDPVWLSYVSSAVYTALNVWLEEVTDADEMHFLHLMGQLAAGG